MARALPRRQVMLALLVACLAFLVPEVGCGDDGGQPAPRLVFRAVTFNTGSGGSPGTTGDATFTPEMKDAADEWYGNGLAWLPAVDAARAFFAEVRPDVVAFQEIFDTADCSGIPAEQWPGFVCETWQEGALHVAQQVLGPDYQVACHLGHSDKCAAVRTSFGTFRGCDQDLCLDGLAGGRVPDCGHGSRVGRGVIDLTDGGVLTLVTFHGSSGVASHDEACRVGQVNQVFVDLGDGEPGANGAWNLIMGDFNADPVLWASFDPSAARWLDFVTNPDVPNQERPFHFITDVGESADGSYAGLFNIDHVVSDAATGSCWIAGLTQGHPGVLSEDIYFDHKPVVCDVEIR